MKTLLKLLTTRLRSQEAECFSVRLVAFRVSLNVSETHQELSC